MTEATTNRCTYIDGGLRCVRERHPDQPEAHVRVNGSWVPDRHEDAA